MSSSISNTGHSTMHSTVPPNGAVAGSSSFEASANAQSSQPVAPRSHTRSRSGMKPLKLKDIYVDMPNRRTTGCFICRLRRKKCDEAHPACGSCASLRLKCEYRRPAWWSSGEQRRIQKERIREKIRETKVMERDGSLQGTQ